MGREHGLFSTFYFYSPLSIPSPLFSYSLYLISYFLFPTIAYTS
jgi:hypothetical protein